MTWVGLTRREKSVLHGQSCGLGSETYTTFLGLSLYTWTFCRCGENGTCTAELACF